MGISIKNKHELWELQQRQSLPLELKIIMTKQRIRDWVEYFGLDACVVSFSGGKDSTVLLHIARQLYPEIKALYCDTLVEFPEVRSFALSVDNVDVVRPKLTFKQVLDKYGYPIISKESAEWIYRLRHYNLSEASRNKLLYGTLPNGQTTYFRLAKKWHYLLNAPFKIGGKCCLALKKRVAASYAKKTGRFAQIVGTMASESKLRTQIWLRQGCNAFDNKDKKSTPLSFWNDTDIWEYIRSYGLKYSSIYEKGYCRSGCVYCCFGVHLEDEPNRFQRLQLSHPKLWSYCMKPRIDGGLGLKEVLEYINVPYKLNQKKDSKI